MSNISVGIVGLPNVGKSTLFNALLKKQQALAANYPFATIEPNIGIVPVPDERLETLANIISGVGADLVSAQERVPTRGTPTKPPIVPATVEFVDIAGLVKGASEGAGLGNKFLSHIREVSVIAHVVRAFEDPDVIREGSESVEADYQTIQTELIIADLQSVQKQLENRKIEHARKAVLEKLLQGLDSGKRAYDVPLEEKETEQIKDVFLLTGKPEIIVLNVSEEQYSEENIVKVVENYAKVLRSAQDDSSASSNQTNMVVICAKIEAELAALSEEEQKLYLADLGLKTSGLERLIKKAYEKLGLISFLTAGEKEVRAWTTQKGATAPVAAGEIHTDFTKKFIKAEVVPFDDFVINHGWKGSREAGKARLEGKEYVMKDGDVVEFKIGA